MLAFPTGYQTRLACDAFSSLKIRFVVVLVYALQFLVLEKACWSNNDTRITRDLLALEYEAYAENEQCIRAKVSIICTAS